MPFFRAYLCLLAAIAGHALAYSQRLHPSVEVADGANRFTARFTISEMPASIGTRYFRVEASTDLVSWQPHYFRYSSHTHQFTQSDYSLLSVSQAVSYPEALGVKISLPPGERTFLRLTPLQAKPEGERFVTEETFNLLASLHRVGWNPDQILFGQEFPLSYSYDASSGNGDLEQSDAKDVVGQHPGVHGVDFHYMMDRPWEEAFHKAAARKAYQDGAVVTIDYHWLGRYGDSFYVEDERDLAILQNVVEGDDSTGDVTWFYDSLDRILGIINDDLRFPFVFRPLHENNGDWFWWGSRIEGSSEVYQEAFRLIVEYMSERSDFLLFCWSPDKALPLEYYPGDDYVDMIGMDVYGPGTVSWLSVPEMVDLVEQAVDFAAARGKVAAITETGYASSSGGDVYYDSVPDWWMNNHLNPILESEKARKVAWALTWINSSWSGPYIPHPGASQAAIDDFQAYFDHPVTLFQDEVAALKVYDAPPEE